MTIRVVSKNNDRLTKRYQHKPSGRYRYTCSESGTSSSSYVYSDYDETLSRTGWKDGQDVVLPCPVHWSPFSIGENGYDGCGDGCGCNSGNGSNPDITPVGTWREEVGGAFLKGLKAGATEIAYKASLPAAWVSGRSEFSGLANAREQAWTDSGLEGTWTQTISQGAANVSVGAGYAAGAVGTWNFAGQGATKVKKIGDDVMEWLGPNSRAIINEAKDAIFQSNDGLREIRFDFNNPSPHKKPHIHLIEYTIKNNKKVPKVNLRFFFE
jgi:hypothetical protein